MSVSRFDFNCGTAKLHQHRRFVVAVAVSFCCRVFTQPKKLQRQKLQRQKLLCNTGNFLGSTRRLLITPINPMETLLVTPPRSRTRGQTSTRNWVEEHRERERDREKKFHLPGSRSSTGPSASGRLAPCAPPLRPPLAARSRRSRPPWRYRWRCRCAPRVSTASSRCRWRCSSGRRRRRRPRAPPGSARPRRRRAAHSRAPWRRRCIARSLLLLLVQGAGA